ncbi:LD-carboxypeptidase [Gorillibacterium sp. CAU 1737]|uniref:S66 peptidase family protein n=1 Tax=Gorillibacterium sp. CAU 1737 TaxID=3140362 RepID=UPI003260522D
MAKRKERTKPRALKPGDTVAIASPASPGDADALAKAATYLEELSLRVRFGETFRLRRGYLAGSDEQRADELNAMFADPGIKAILCSRGGYGTARIADRLDYELIQANPKIFWGFSDITYLHTAIRQRTGLVTFHGPMLVDLTKQPVHRLTLASFALLFSTVPFRFPEEESPLDVLVEGEAAGELVGGNLALLTSTLGTPFELDTAGKLLLIEDIHEPPYRVDHMLNQLRLAGKLDDAAGFVVGDFSDSAPRNPEESLTLREVWNDYLVPLGKPCMSGFSIGHCSPNVAVPLGVRAVLRTSQRELAFVEPALLQEGGTRTG